MSGVSVVIPCRRPEDPALKELGRDYVALGALEVILQGGEGISWARNEGARRAKGSIVVHSDDDATLVGDFRWFDTRPDRERWWVASRWTDASGDPYTITMCARLTGLVKVLPSMSAIGPFTAVRREPFLRLGGLSYSSVYTDTEFARRAARVWGNPVVAPFEVVVRRRFSTMGEIVEQHAERLVRAGGGPG